MAESKGSYVGGMWVKEGKKGQYLSIALDLKRLLKDLGVDIDQDEFKVNMFGFINDKKKSDNSPDYTIMYFEPKEK